MSEDRSERKLESDVRPGGTGYLEPFRLRALGIARHDEDLIAEADRKFRALGLDWHASQTPYLRDLRSRN